MERLDEEYKINPISQPEHQRRDAIELPEAGPMTFEFEVEVRSRLRHPLATKALKVKRPDQDRCKDIRR